MAVAHGHDEELRALVRPAFVSRAKFRWEMSQQAKIRNGKIGEVLVELELLKRDWHVERLDGAAKAVNGDLIAIRGVSRVVIQVKSALSWKRPSFGHADLYLLEGKPFFNKDNPTVVSDALVTVCGSAEAPLFHVFGIDDAERLAREHAQRWYERELRTGGKRSPHFPLSFHLEDAAILHAHGAWYVLEGLAR